MEMIILLIRYMKKIIWGILFLMLMVAVFIFLILYFAPQPEEREYSGLFIRGIHSHNGHLYKT